jgi:hypothetical protein
MKLLGIISVGFNVTDQLIIFSAFVEKKWEYNETVHRLFIDFKKAYDSVRREVLYNILIEFGVLINLVRLIKMYFRFKTRRFFTKTAFELCFRTCHLERSGKLSEAVII